MPGMPPGAPPGGMMPPPGAPGAPPPGLFGPSPALMAQDGFLARPAASLTPQDKWLQLQLETLQKYFAIAQRHQVGDQHKYGESLHLHENPSHRL